MAAQLFVAELVGQMYKIADLRLPGSPRDWVREGLRAFPYKQRCIYFRSYEDSIVIVRVLHGKQDIESVFRQEEGCDEE
jgi:toxin ParE1/3/4